MSDILSADYYLVEPSRGEVERILLTEPEIVAIHWPPDWELGHVNRDLWRASVESNVYSIKLLERYLRAPCIEDKFGSDMWSRRLWKGTPRRNMTPMENASLYSCIANDALRYGTLSNTDIVAGSLFRDYVGGNQPEMAPYVQELRKMIPENYVEYDTLTTKQKIELVGRLKERLYHVLRNFYMPEPIASD
jgi:hypothetical protein